MKDFDYPGVYGLSVDGKVLYVGSSKNVRKRLREHFSQLKRGKHKRELQEKFDSGKEVVPICLKRFDEKVTHYDLLLCENKWINGLHPICNCSAPLEHDLTKTISWLNYEARERRYGTIHNKYDCYRSHDETKESEIYDTILDLIDRYYSFLETEERFPFDKASNIKYLVVRTDYETWDKVKKASYESCKSLPQFIMDAIKDHLENSTGG